MTTSYILDAVRTPRGRGKAGKGALSHIHPQELLGQVLRTLAQRGTFAAEQVDDVTVGCVSQIGEQGANVARNAVLAAGWPDAVSAVSLNRFCGSGLQAINFAAMGVASGAMQLAVAGGVESMSRVPMGADGAGQDGGNVRLRDRVFQIPQGISADLIATLYGLTRAELDAVALRSQQNAARAIAEVMGVDIELVTDDQRLRPEKSEVERLWASNAKALDLLGWQPAYGSREGFLRGLRETVAWFREPANLAAYKSHIYNV